MIEIQIFNKEIYDKLKQNAIYHSDLTQVCSFRDEFSDVLKENGLKFDEVEVVEGLPLLTITSKNIMKLEGASAEMLHFVGVRSEMDPTIALKNMNEVNMLISNGLVELSDSFKKLYSKLGYRSKIKELVCANVKFATKGKMIDYIDSDLSIQSLKFPECKEKAIVYKQMHLKVKSNIEKKDKYDQIYTEDEHGEKIVLRFFNKPLILKSIAFEGNKISIATSKVLEIKEGLVVYDPIILPKGLDFRKDIMFTPPDRKIPADLYRNALYEFNYRYKVEEKIVGEK